MLGRDIMRCKAYLDYYTVSGVRETCHAVKQDLDPDLRQKALIEIASVLASTGVADETSYLVPSPQHTGTPIYTKEIAELIASETGAHLLDIVRCEPHEPFYEHKIRGSFDIPKFFIVSEYPERGSLVLIDNVISSGSTYRAINALFDRELIPLVYAVDYATLGTQSPFELIPKFQ